MSIILCWWVHFCIFILLHICIYIFPIIIQGRTQSMPESFDWYETLENDMMWKPKLPPPPEDTTMHLPPPPEDTTIHNLTHIAVQTPFTSSQDQHQYKSPYLDHDGSIDIDAILLSTKHPSHGKQRIPGEGKYVTRVCAVCEYME